MARQPDGPKGDINWEEVWAKISGNRSGDELSNFFKQGRVILILIGIVVVIWLLTGIYTVGPGEVGVVRTFGHHSATTSPGLNYHWPWPIQRVTNVDIEEIRSTEIGFTRSGDEEEDYKPESLMLTGDGNIVKVWLQVQYQVVDPVAYVFNVRNPEEVIHSATEVVLRGVIGQMDVDTVLTTGIDSISVNTKSELQTLLDRYQTGIRIHVVNVIDTNPPDQVDAAYKDVSTAKQDKDRAIEEARGYAADIVPVAKGNKEKTLLEAEAYREKRILEAQGDATKFLKILREHEVSAAFEALADYGVTRAVEALNEVGEPDVEITIDDIQFLETGTVDLTIAGTPVTESTVDQGESSTQSEDAPSGDNSTQVALSSPISRSVLFEIMSELGVVSVNQEPGDFTGKALYDSFLRLDSREEYAGIAAKYDENLTQAIKLTTKRLYLETMETVLNDTEKYVIDPEASGNLMPFLPLDDLTKEEVVPTVPADSKEEVVQ